MVVCVCDPELGKWRQCRRTCSRDFWSGLDSRLVFLIRPRVSRSHFPSNQKRKETSFRYSYGARASAVDFLSRTTAKNSKDERESAGWRCCPPFFHLRRQTEQFPCPSPPRQRKFPFPEITVVCYVNITKAISVAR